MAKKNLLIVDEDEAYLRKIRDFVRESDISDKYSVRIFTKQETLEHFLSSPEGQNLDGAIVAKPHLIRQDIRENPRIKWIGLDEAGPGLRTEPFPILGKYQPLRMFFSAIDEFCGLDADSLPGRRENCRVISVYSACGGVGKTAFALNISRILALSGKKVFYLSLETIPGAPDFFPKADSADFPDILYYLKAVPEKLAAKINALKKHDPFSRIDFFGFPANMKDVLELNQEETRRLVNTICEAGGYDILVIDLESTFHGRVTAALKESNVVYWLLQGGFPGIYRNKLLLEQYSSLLEQEGEPLMEKTRFLLGKWVGDPPYPRRLEDWDLSGVIPYVPEWKTMFRRDQIFGNERFHVHCQQICEPFVGHEGREGS